jgi:hypothetical protein
MRHEFSATVIFTESAQIMEREVSFDPLRPSYESMHKSPSAQLITAMR